MLLCVHSFNPEHNSVNGAEAQAAGESSEKKNRGRELNGRKFRPILVVFSHYIQIKATEKN